MARAVVLLAFCTIAFAPSALASARGDCMRASDIDTIIAACTEIIRSAPSSGNLYYRRGVAYQAKGNLEAAASDLTRAIAFRSRDVAPYLARSEVYRAMGDHKAAEADLARAAEINPRLRDPRREASRRKDDVPAVARIEPTAPARVESTVNTARPKLVEPTLPVSAAAPGRRVALVIANTKYGSVGQLPNSGNDGRAIAASLRRLGFSEVIERYDLDLTAMSTTLRDFGDKSASADWAVVYFAGHGIEVNGQTYLIPTDARLERDTHVVDETVHLGRVLEKVEGAKKLRLVILDACRNNPYVSRMVRHKGTTRSIGRGLPQIEPEGGVLVAYSAKHGTTAEDGAEGGNSPFAKALLSQLEVPGLEINFLFRRVRDQVLAATGKRQEPYLYGSLPSESLYFRQAAKQ